MKKCLTTLVVLFMLKLCAFAQKRTLAGKISNEKGAPIQSVSVVSPGGNFYLS